MRFRGRKRKFRWDEHKLTVEILRSQGMIFTTNIATRALLLDDIQAGSWKRDWSVDEVMALVSEGLTTRDAVYLLNWKTRRRHECFFRIFQLISMGVWISMWIVAWW